MNPNPLKILVVEDEAPLLNAMSIKLKKLGFIVFQGHDGVEGLQVALQEHPSLVVSDIVMPNMNGLKMLEQIRQDAWGKSVPVILLTNLSENEDMERANALGVLDFLVKSNWRLDDITNKIKERLAINPVNIAPQI